MADVSQALGEALAGVRGGSANRRMGPRDGAAKARRDPGSREQPWALRVTRSSFVNKAEFELYLKKGRDVQGLASLERSWH